MLGLCCSLGQCFSVEEYTSSKFTYLLLCILSSFVFNGTKMNVLCSPLITGFIHPDCHFVVVVIASDSKLKSSNKHP